MPEALRGSPNKGNESEWHPVPVSGVSRQRLNQGFLLDKDPGDHRSEHQGDHEQGQVTPVRYHGSAHFSALAATNALLMMSAGTDRIAQGSMVHVRQI